MLECLKFILSFLLKILNLLFTIDVGFTSLGVVLCIVFILFPIMLAIVHFIKTTFVSELDERYDENRPRESHVAQFRESAPYKNGYMSYSHTFSKSRRLKR